MQETEGICGGYPRVANTRIPVWSLVLAFREFGSFGDVVATFPTLSESEIHAALDWYIRFPARIDEDIRRNEATLDEIADRAWPA